jgi:methylmalonyl-CoA/ethylmalonyl-CoA epimerase|tara:strand:- start:914 stop:1396 length:483 start_codon:yes stop_codon:yes gene_type:complete
MIEKIKNEIIEIKHMAFAVEDIDKSLNFYKIFLGVPKDVQIQDMPKSRTRVAVFNIGDIEYQLCQSQDSEGRFSKWIKEKGQGGLHHICYVVKNLDDSIKLMIEGGANLRECKACKVTGNHPHPEGFIAFLDNEVDNIEVELMQVYTEDELEKYKSYQGI